MTDPAQHEPDQRHTPLKSPVALCIMLGVTALIIAGDLYLKYWSFENVSPVPVVLTELVTEDHNAFWRQYPHDPIVVVPGVLNLHLTTNTGAVFGLGKGGRPLFIGVSVIAMVVIFVMFARSRADAWGFHLSLALILAGALGNLYDRAVYGAVRDMFHMLPGTGLWPWIFNLADVALMVGVGLVVVLTFLSDRKRKKLASPPTPAP